MKLKKTLESFVPCADPTSFFNEVADILLNNGVLCINNTRYRLAEIEFYYRHTLHCDCSVYCHDAQMNQYFTWYAHASGLDITFGNKKCCGGILIRAILNADTGEYIYGPLKSREALCGKSKIEEVKNHIEKNHWCDVWSETKLSEEKVYSTSRYGLSENQWNCYEKKPYRYFIMPKAEHAEKEKIGVDLKKRENYTAEILKETFGYLAQCWRDE